MDTFNINLYIFLGCGFGGLCRYWAANLLYALFGKQFPIGTLFVNFSGSLIMGFLFVLILERFNGLSDVLRPLILIGFLGGYTTFSSFSIETLSLLVEQSYLAACANILLSVILCLLAAWIGVKLGRLI